MLRDIGRADLIILDEFGYGTHRHRQGAPALQIIAGSYERRNIIFLRTSSSVNGARSSRTTNSPQRSSTASCTTGGSSEFTGQNRRVSEALMFGRNTSRNRRIRKMHATA